MLLLLNFCFPLQLIIPDRRDNPFITESRRGLLSIGNNMEAARDQAGSWPPSEIGTLPVKPFDLRLVQARQVDPGMSRVSFSVIKTHPYRYSNPK